MVIFHYESQRFKRSRPEINRHLYLRYYLFQELNSSLYLQGLLTVAAAETLKKEQRLKQSGFAQHNYEQSPWVYLKGGYR